MECAPNNITNGVHVWNRNGVPGWKAERRLGGWRQRWLQCERDGSHARCHQHWQRRGIWRVKERRGLAVLPTSSFALPSHRFDLTCDDDDDDDDYEF